MSLKLLPVLFKIGSFFGITPWSLHVPKISRLQNLHCLLLFVILMYGFIAREAVQLRNYSSHLILLYIINNIAFVGQNSAFLLRSLMKTKSWISFLQNLELTAKSTHVRTGRTSKNYLFCGFLIVSILHLLTVTLLGHAYAQFFYNIWSEFYAEYLHTLMNFHNQFLSCLLVNMIRTRYKNLRKMVQVHFERRRKIQLDALKRVQYIVRSLKVTVDGYNDLFGWTNLFNICLSLARILNITQLLLFQLNRPQFLTVKVLNLIFITWILVNVGVSKI